MMKSETVLETSVSFINLTRLIAQKKLLICRLQSFRSNSSAVISILLKLIRCCYPYQLLSNSVLYFVQEYCDRTKNRSCLPCRLQKNRNSIVLLSDVTYYFHAIKKTLPVYKWTGRWKVDLCDCWQSFDSVKQCNSLQVTSATILSASSRKRGWYDNIIKKMI
jgi:hypothetical protein